MECKNKKNKIFALFIIMVLIICATIMWLNGMSENKQISEKQKEELPKTIKKEDIKKLAKTDDIEIKKELEKLQTEEEKEISKNKILPAKPKEVELVEVVDIVENEEVEIIEEKTKIEKEEIENKIEPKLLLSLKYSSKEISNENVTVTINSNIKLKKLEGWELSKDSLSLKKVYEENTNETVLVKDVNGNSKKEEIKITNIDKELPILNIYYSEENITKNDVEVIIKSNKTLKEVDGFILSDDKKQLSKTYKQNENKTIHIQDTSGNIVNTNINVNNIDKTSPVAEVNYIKLENGKIKLVITSNEEIQKLEDFDISADKLTLSKELVENYSGELTIKDLAGNETKVAIEIPIEKKFINPKILYSTEEKTDENVTVKIETEKEIKEVEGFYISEDKCSLTKDYEENVKEEIILEDMYGNKEIIKVEIENIEKLEEKNNEDIDNVENKEILNEENQIELGEKQQDDEL